MNFIDINCDMGESFGAYSLGKDEEILTFVTSDDIPCGFHARDPAKMTKTVHLASEYNVGIGVHPALPDLVGFVRRIVDISPAEAYKHVLYQIGALSSF